MSKAHHILASLLVLGVALAVGATPAFAEHVFSLPAFGSFGQPGEAAGIAVDQETGNVYVGTEGTGLPVNVFGPSGGSPVDGVPGEIYSNSFAYRFGTPRGVAVDNACYFHEPRLTAGTPECEKVDPSNGDVYVASSEENKLEKFALNAMHEYELAGEIPIPATGVHAVAVDHEGNVYAASTSQQIFEFNPEGREVATIPEHVIPHPAPGYIAVGAPGVIYIGAGETFKGVAKIVLDSNGQVSSETMLDAEGRAVAVDQSGNAYVDNGSSVAEYDAEGELVGSFGESEPGALNEPRFGEGIAVNDATGQVYVSDDEHVERFAPVFVPGAKISEQQATNVRETAATLQAAIDPNEAPVVSCVFEYGTSSSYGQSVPCAPASLPAGKISVPASAQLQGLAPGASYYFRVVAGSELETSPGKFEVKDSYGPNEVLTTPALPGSAPETCPNAGLRAEQPFGLTLPDCRAYEMVSPLEKDDNGILHSDARTSLSGDALAYLSDGSFSGPQGAPASSDYFSRRGPDGWSTQNISGPHALFNTHLEAPFQELWFTPELSKGLLHSAYYPLVEGEPAGFFNLYVDDFEAGVYHKVTTVTPPGEAPYNGSPTEAVLAGASSDLSHVVFQEYAPLSEGASPGHLHVYEWAAGRLSQVDVPPEGVKFEGEAFVGAPGNFDETKAGDVWHAVSENGMRVFFTEGEVHQGSKELGQLYVRENPTEPQSEIGEHGECTEPAKACTVEVSASQRTNSLGLPKPDPNGPQPAFFRDASANGERVFFTSRAELTNDAYTGPDDNAANLYEYDLQTGALTDLTVDDEAATDGAAVLGLVTAGEDGSYVYFVANGVLATGANPNGEKAAPGNCKQDEEEAPAGRRVCGLYVEHYNGSEWEAPTFVATLAGGNVASNAVLDETDWVGYERRAAGDYGVPLDDFGPGSHTARVTPDGTRLAFESYRSLTGAETERAERGECNDKGAGGRCREVYLYDASTEKLVCASCDPSGARPVGDAELGGTEAAGGTSFAFSFPYYLPRNLSEDGSRLFFQSPDPLVPHDSDGKLDVYELEQPGEGGCTEASGAYSHSSAGCLFAISDVAGDNASHFMDASPNGEDVFIDTADQLLPSDTDTREDVYDVRVGGGFPVAAAPPACDNADSCKPPVSPQPGVFGAPASATFSGPGNPPPPSSSAVVEPKPLTRAQKLAKALKVCAKDKQKSKRAKCQKQAKQKYGASKAKKSAHTNRRTK